MVQALPAGISNGTARILLLTYGEPVQPNWGTQYDYSRRILSRLTRLVAPIPRPALPILAAYRGWRRVSLWRSERYTSPLARMTRKQASALEAALRESEPGVAWEVVPAFEFTPPLLEDVLRERGTSGPERLVFLPMYLVDCDFTTGISRRWLAEEAARGSPATPAPQYVIPWDRDDELVALMARFVLERTSEMDWSESQWPSTGLLLGVHGTLVEAAPGVDTGLEATRDFYRRLSALLAPRFAVASIGWLNHWWGGKWTSPDLRTAARRMAAGRIRKAVYFPFGFLADNAETQLEGRRIFRRIPELEILHLPCLNDWPPFIDFLARRVRNALKSEDAVFASRGVR